MRRDFPAIENQVRSLDLAAKAELLRVLVEELDLHSEADVDAALTAVIQRRSREVGLQVVPAAPAKVVVGRFGASTRR
jgi:hypothetical protein